MPIDWDKIIDDAARETDAQFESKISSLTRLNDAEIESIIMETGISKQDLSSVLKEVKDTTKSNLAKANAIKNISKGVDVVIGIASKFIQNYQLKRITIQSTAWLEHSGHANALY